MDSQFKKPSNPYSARQQQAKAAANPPAEPKPVPPSNPFDPKLQTTPKNDKTEELVIEKLMADPEPAPAPPPVDPKNKRRTRAKKVGVIFLFILGLVIIAGGSYLAYTDLTAERGSDEEIEDTTRKAKEGYRILAESCYTMEVPIENKAVPDQSGFCSVKNMTYSEEYTDFWISGSSDGSYEDTVYEAEIFMSESIAKAKNNPLSQLTPKEIDKEVKAGELPRTKDVFVDDYTAIEITSISANGLPLRMVIIDSPSYIDSEGNIIESFKAISYQTDSRSAASFQDMLNSIQFNPTNVEQQ